MGCIVDQPTIRSKGLGALTHGVIAHSGGVLLLGLELAVVAGVGHEDGVDGHDPLGEHQLEGDPLNLFVDQGDKPGEFGMMVHQGK